MKIEEKQQVAPMWLVFLFGTLTVFIVTLSIQDGLDGSDGNIALARNRAEVLAYQVLQLRREAQKTENAINNYSGRGPASVLKEEVVQKFSDKGEIGQDPWGNPYRYQIINERGVQRVEVWSNSNSAGQQANPIKVVLEDKGS